MEPENPGALAVAISRMVGDEGLRSRLGENGRARAEEFGWERVAKQYVECYRDCLESERPSGRRVAAADELAGVRA